MILDDNDLHTTQERILLFERLLEEARQVETPANYQAMAEGYLMEIDKMQLEIREYLRQSPEAMEAA